MKINLAIQITKDQLLRKMMLLLYITRQELLAILKASFIRIKI